MFSGSHALTIDDKGRLAIPARFRAQIATDCAGQLVITRVPAGVRLFPMPVFEHIAKTVIPAHPVIAQREVLRELFVGEAINLDMDAQGRLLLPTAFRAELGANAMLVGQVDCFALWSESAWARRKAESAAAYADAFAALNL